MADRSKQLLARIEAHNDSAQNACAAVWDLIQAQAPEEGKEYFKTFLSQVYLEDVYKKAGRGFLSDEVIRKMVEKIGDLGNRVVINLVKQGLPEDEFYANLWEKIGDTALLPDREAQIAFLGSLWMDAHIPYYQIGEGCMMDEEEFARIKAKIWPTMKKAFFIMTAPLKQRTQRMSLLMELAEGLADDRERAVYWACIINRVQGSTRSKEKP